MWVHGLCSLSNLQNTITHLRDRQQSPSAEDKFVYDGLVL
jgi:hypothetical protein